MSEIVWESDAQSSGFTLMDNGMVWPDDWPGTLVEAQFTSARGDGADLDRDPDMVPSGPGLVTFTPLVRTVGYDGEHGKRIVSLHPFEAVVGDDGYLYTPDEYGEPGIRGIVLPSNNSDVVDEHDWTWRVTFDIPDTTIRPTNIPTPHDHSVDIKDYLDSDANYGVRVVVDRVAARETLAARDETLAARDETLAARDLVLPARDQTLAARDETLQHGITVDTSVGTRVYVGDTMIYGDTGWRDIQDLCSGVRWDVTAGQPISLMRRVDDQIFFKFRFRPPEDAIGTQQNIALMDGTIPSGFRESPASFAPFGSYEVINGDHIYISNAAGTSRVTIYANSNWRDANHPVEGRYFTDQPWPTSLPGSPV